MRGGSADPELVGPTILSSFHKETKLLSSSMGGGVLLDNINDYNEEDTLHRIYLGYINAPEYHWVKHKCHCCQVKEEIFQL